jgi:hypothetical protein
MIKRPFYVMLQEQISMLKIPTPSKTALIVLLTIYKKGRCHAWQRNSRSHENDPKRRGGAKRSRQTFSVN